MHLLIAALSAQPGEFVLLAPGGRLYAQADAEGPASEEWDHEPLPLEVIEDEGGWLRVRTADRGHCYQDLGTAPDLDVELYVRRDRLAPVIPAHRRVEQEDGSWVELTAGLAVLDGLVVFPGAVDLLLALEDGLVLSYLPDEELVPVDEDVDGGRCFRIGLTPSGPMDLGTAGGRTSPERTVTLWEGEPLYDSVGEVVGTVRRDTLVASSSESVGCTAPFGGGIVYCEPSYVVVRDDVRLLTSPLDPEGVRYGRGKNYLSLQLVGVEGEFVQVAFPQNPDEHCHGVRGLPTGLRFWVRREELQAVTTKTTLLYRPGAVVTSEHLDTGRMLFPEAFPTDAGMVYRPNPVPPLPADLSLVADDQGWLGDYEGTDVYIARGDQVAAVRLDRRDVRLQDRCGTVTVKTRRNRIRPFYEPEFADPVLPLTGMNERLKIGTALFFLDGSSAGWARQELKVQEVEGACGTLLVGEDSVRVCW